MPGRREASAKNGRAKGEVCSKVSKGWVRRKCRGSWVMTCPQAPPPLHRIGNHLPARTKICLRNHFLRRNTEFDVESKTASYAIAINKREGFLCRGENIHNVHFLNKEVLGFCVFYYDNIIVIIAYD